MRRQITLAIAGAALATSCKPKGPTDAEIAAAVSLAAPAQTYSTLRCGSRQARMIDVTSVEVTERGTPNTRYWPVRVLVKARCEATSLGARDRQPREEWGAVEADRAQSSIAAQVGLRPPTPGPTCECGGIMTFQIIQDDFGKYIARPPTGP